jgi:hypothetical protein
MEYWCPTPAAAGAPILYYAPRDQMHGGAVVQAVVEDAGGVLGQTGSVRRPRRNADITSGKTFDLLATASARVMISSDANATQLAEQVPDDCRVPMNDVPQVRGDRGVELTG